MSRWTAWLLRASGRFSVVDFFELRNGSTILCLRIRETHADEACYESGTWWAASSRRNMLAKISRISCCESFFTRFTGLYLRPSSCQLKELRYRHIPRERDAILRRLGCEILHQAIMRNSHLLSHIDASSILWTGMPPTQSLLLAPTV